MYRDRHNNADDGRLFVFVECSRLEKAMEEAGIPQGQAKALLDKIPEYRLVFDALNNTYSEYNTKRWNR